MRSHTVVFGNLFLGYLPLLLLGLSCTVGCPQNFRTTPALSIDPVAVQLGTIELEKQVDFPITIRSNGNDFSIEKTLTSCGCLQIQAEKAHIPKHDACIFSCRLSSGSEAGPFQQFGRIVLRNLATGQPEIVDVPIQYFVKPIPKLIFFNESALRFSNENTFRYKIGFSVKRRASEHPMEQSQVLANSQLNGFQVAGAEVSRISTLNGMVDDRWAFDLEIDANAELPKELLFSCDGKSYLSVQLRYDDLRHPVEASVKSLFFGILTISEEKRLSLDLRNNSREAVVIKEVVVDSSSKLQVNIVPSLVIEPGAEVAIDCRVSPDGPVGRHMGAIRVVFETPDLKEVQIPVTWIVK